MIDTLAQIGVAFTGLTAVFLTQSKRETWRRAACLFGMAGEPFWFYTAIAHHQWGIFVLTFFYTFSWGKGVWQYWIQPRRDEPCFYYPECTIQGEHAHYGLGEKWWGS